VVLIQDAAVLNRHVPAAEINHFAARGYMGVEERSFLGRKGGGSFRRHAAMLPRTGGKSIRGRVAMELIRGYEERLPFFMNVIDFLERRFGRFAIPGLVRIIVGLNLLVYLLCRINPFVLSWLELDPNAVCHGQVWRLVTYIFIPNYGSIFSAVFEQPGNALDTAIGLLFLWMIGENLEAVWGAFRLNLFYLVGMLGTTLAAFLFGAQFSNGMLNLSLLFAFAWYFPNVQIYLFYILPVLVKWIAWFSAAMLLWQFVTSDNLSYRMAVIASLANFLLFFGPEIVSRALQRKQVEGRRRDFVKASIPEGEPLHRCVVCQRSDVSHPELEFRVGRDGNDYCLEHIPTRPNVTTQ